MNKNDSEYMTDLEKNQNQQTKSLKLNTNSSLFIPSDQGKPAQAQSNLSSIQNISIIQNDKNLPQNQQQQIKNPIISTSPGIQTAFQNQYYQNSNFMASKTNSSTNQSNVIANNQFSNMNIMSQMNIENQRNTSSIINDKDQDKIIQSILNLKNPQKREEILQELSKKKESFLNLAPYLWNSFGTIAILLQEIISIYPLLSPPQLCQISSQRVCSVLGLLQCLALHSDTKNHFLNAHIPLFLYPFLNTSNKAKPFENLRVTSLGVIGALVKGDDSEAIHFLMQTEIIPLCLRIMKRGQELSRTVATFIVQKILLDPDGLNYICQTAERFFAVATVLQNMIEDLKESEKNDQRLLRHIIRCYLRLSENNRAFEALKKCLPRVLHNPDGKFITDEIVKKWHINLLENLKLLPA